VGIGEVHPLGDELIDVRGLHVSDFRVVGGNGIEAHVIGEDEDDVWFYRCLHSLVVVRWRSSRRWKIQDTRSKTGECEFHGEWLFFQDVDVVGAVDFFVSGVEEGGEAGFTGFEVEGKDGFLVACYDFGFCFLVADLEAGFDGFDFLSGHSAECLVSGDVLASGQGGIDGLVGFFWPAAQSEFVGAVFDDFDVPESDHTITRGGGADVTLVPGGGFGGDPVV